LEEGRGYLILDLISKGGKIAREKMGVIILKFHEETDESCSPEINSSHINIRNKNLFLPRS